ncbi:hypothetical protein D3C87_1287400 [compost metagenome]
MRDKRFVAEHRGGVLTITNHRKLMRWAIDCLEHILTLVDIQIDIRLLDVLSLAKEWELGNIQTGKAMKASLAAHAVARELTDPVHVFIARAIGQAVATAHMADHCLGGAIYGLKALKAAGRPLDEEKEWQNNRLRLSVPVELAELVISTRNAKAKF